MRGNNNLELLLLPPVPILRFPLLLPAAAACCCLLLPAAACCCSQECGSHRSRMHQYWITSSTSNSTGTNTATNNGTVEMISTVDIDSTDDTTSHRICNSTIARTGTSTGLGTDAHALINGSHLDVVLI